MNKFFNFFRNKKLFYFLIILFFFPLNLTWMDNLDINESLEEETNKRSYFNYFLGTFIVFSIIFYFYNYGLPFSDFNQKDPYDLTIEYKYPNDGQIRPPQNPPTVAQKDYFVIPDKPYFVNGERNFPLLNKDMLEYQKMEHIYIKGVSIPPFFVKWLEICYGYDITQEFFYNLELHRRIIPNEVVGMDWIYGFVKWYYKKDPTRPLGSIWFTQNELAYFEGKDFYDLRIFPYIYTRKWDLPMI